MTERKSPNRPDPRAINPRYHALRLRDAVRVLTRPKNLHAKDAGQDSGEG